MCILGDWWWVQLDLNFIIHVFVEELRSRRAITWAHLLTGECLSTNKGSTISSKCDYIVWLDAETITFGVQLKPKKYPIEKPIIHCISKPCTPIVWSVHQKLSVSFNHTKQNQDDQYLQTVAAETIQRTFYTDGPCIQCNLTDDTSDF